MGPFAIAVAITVIVAAVLFPAMRGTGRLRPALVATPPRIEEVVFLPVPPDVQPPDETSPPAPVIRSVLPDATPRVRPPTDSAPAPARAEPRDSSRLTPLAPGMARIPPLFPPAGAPRGLPCIGACETGSGRRFGEASPPPSAAERDSVIEATMAE